MGSAVVLALWLLVGCGDSPDLGTDSVFAPAPVGMPPAGPGGPVATPVAGNVAPGGPQPIPGVSPGPGPTMDVKPPVSSDMDASVPLSDAGEPDAEPADGSTGEPAPPLELPFDATEMFPLPGATGLCNDPPLRIGFARAPTLGTRGRVQVFSDSQPETPVAVIDLGVPVRTESRGGRDFQQPAAAFIDGTAVVFALPPDALERGQRYHVKIDAGVLLGPSGPIAIDDATTWTFETAAAGPGDRTRLAVGLDGKAPFCTVQGAIDAVPAGNAVATTIEIGVGGYYGLVHWSDKDKLTLRGADREGTRIAGTNNNNLNPSTRTRPLFSIESSSDVAIENLTIHNLTPQGGSQAEALALFDCDRCALRDANVLSLQDTLLWNGRIYAENSLIAGNVDFVWGYGAAFFKACEIRTVGRKGYIVQARNGADGHGYVFVDSRITADPGITGAVLARIDASAYPYSHVAFIDCEIGRHISAAGWTVTGGLGLSLRFWEYGSKDSAGNPISTAGRASGSRQLSASEAAMMRDPGVVLGGWRP